MIIFRAFKSRLTSFYKATHPDLLTNAPKHVRDANTTAITALNSYIDSIENHGTAQIKAIKFFTPIEEAYKEVRVTLLPLKEDSGAQAKKDHIDSTVKTLDHAINPPKTKIPQYEIPKRKRYNDQKDE